MREILLRDEMLDEVEELLAMASWRQLLSIREPAICMLTLEVLASFEFDRSYSSFSSNNAIQFCAFGQYHNISVTQFSVQLGLCNEAFSDTEEYEQLSTDYLGSLTPQHAYRALCGQLQYELGVSKATCLSRLAYRCIRIVLE